MRKKIIIVLLFISVSLIIAACGSGADVDSEEGSGDGQVTISYGHYFPEDDIHGQEAEVWAELVEEKSNGEIEVDIFPNEQLVAGSDGFQSVANGTIDVYLNISTYFSGQVPLIDIYNFPFPHPSYSNETVANLASEANELYDHQFEDNNVKNLGLISTTGSTSFFLTEPAYNMEELAGRAVRGAGALGDRGMSMIGMSPEFMAASEQYPALQNGNVDGVMTAYTSFSSMNLHEVAPFWLRSNIILTPYFLNMNLDKWETLSEEHQEILIEATSETLDWFLEEIEVLEEEIIEEAKANDVEIYELPDEEWERWNEAIQPLFDEYIEDNGEVAEELVEIYDKHSEN